MTVFTDPEPCRGYESNRTVGKTIVIEQEIEHSTEERESHITEIEDKIFFTIKPVIIVFDQTFC